MVAMYGEELQTGSRVPFMACPRNLVGMIEQTSLRPHVDLTFIPIELDAMNDSF